MSEVKKALVTFHYAERIKANLILAAKLLESLGDTREEEILGAEKLLVAYFRALIGEVNIASGVSGVGGFQKVNLKLEDAIEQVKKHNYLNAERLVSEAVVITTTSGVRAAQFLKEKALI
ncbi:MAG: hypothetical protein ACUVUF_02720 [Candidatus Bathycorpusculaceae bacterium]